MLKRLFTSNTRIKLLSIFLMNPGEEFFIRELTRRLNEQINSVRRELDNLKKAGFLKSKNRLRKKYYHINDKFILLDELKSIFLKSLNSNQEIADNIAKMGSVKLLILSGQFVDEKEDLIDMLIVGKIDKNKLANYLNKELRTKNPVKFTVLSEEDFKYRKDCKDKFITEIVNNQKNQTLIKEVNL